MLYSDTWNLGIRLKQNNKEPQTSQSWAFHLNAKPVSYLDNEELLRSSPKELSDGCDDPLCVLFSSCTVSKVSNIPVILKDVVLQPGFWEDDLMPLLDSLSASVRHSPNLLILSYD